MFIDFHRFSSIFHRFFMDFPRFSSVFEAELRRIRRESKARELQEHPGLADGGGKGLEPHGAQLAVAEVEASETPLAPWFRAGFEAFSGCFGCQTPGKRRF